MDEITEKIYDINGNELDKSAIDLSKGYISYEPVLKEHHKAVKAKKAVYEDRVMPGTENMVPGGLHQMYLVSPAIPAQEAWDEYETRSVYREYTDEQLNNANKDPAAEIDKLAAQVFYTAMMTDTIIPEDDA